LWDDASTVKVRPSSLGGRIVNVRRLPLFVAALALSCSAWAQQGYIPDHTRTPGAIDPDIASTVCVPGYTKTIRPPSSYTNHLKAKQMRELGLPGTPHDCHEDHVVPLCVGGHPSDPGNLWPQPVTGKWTDKVNPPKQSSW
jgi:hypothetical protein